MVLSAPTWASGIVCVQRETTSELSLPPISQHHAKDYPVTFRPDSAEVFPSTTTALLRLTKNDRLRTSKPMLIYTHTRPDKHLHTHTDTRYSNTHLCPAASPPPLTFPNTCIQTHRHLCGSNLTPQGDDCISAQRLTRE